MFDKDGAFVIMTLEEVRNYLQSSMEYLFTNWTASSNVLRARSFTTTSPKICKIMIGAPYNLPIGLERMAIA